MEFGGLLRGRLGQGKEKQKKIIKIINEQNVDKVRTIIRRRMLWAVTVFKIQIQVMYQLDSFQFNEH